MLGQGFDTLKKKSRELRENFAEPLALRTHRAISWIGRAEQETEDFDAAFIFSWIAFNAAYAEEIVGDANEQANFQKFFDALVKLDNNHKIYDLVWKRFPNEIRLLLDNQFIYAPYWKYINGDAYYEDWLERMDKEKLKVNKCLASKDTISILTILFGRLYVLRNQMVHGGATWNSKVNRSQVRDCAAFLTSIMPVFVNIMMDNPDYKWGMPFYYVVK